MPTNRLSDSTINELFKYFNKVGQWKIKEENMVAAGVYTKIHLVHLSAVEEPKISIEHNKLILVKPQNG